MSSARTPTRVGFGEVLVCPSLTCIHLFAALMVGAPPDDIGAQRLAEGGVSASGAGSAKAVANTINSHYTKNGKANVDPQSTAAH